ncbi:MAG: ECF-type sigma factor [Planctomycetota bacterium]
MAEPPREPATPDPESQSAASEYSDAHTFAPEEEGMFTAVYDQLREAAGRWMSNERRGHSFQPTDLVHEVYLRMGDEGDQETDRERFLAFAGIAMRRILIDRARKVRALKRGGDMSRMPLSQVDVGDTTSPIDLVSLEEALNNLDQIRAGLSEVVILRFLLGCGVEETARVLRVSAAKVKKDWAFARAWLQVELGFD